MLHRSYWWKRSFNSYFVFILLLLLLLLLCCLVLWVCALGAAGVKPLRIWLIRQIPDTLQTLKKQQHQRPGSLVLCTTETKMSSFWRNFNHWLHWKLSFWQLPVQPVMKISSKWRHFRFSGSANLRYEFDGFEKRPYKAWGKDSFPLHDQITGCFVR